MMPRRQFWLPVLLFIIIGGSLLSPVAADCQVNGATGSNGTAGNDTIICNNPSAPTETIITGGTGGDDQITVNSNDPAIIIIAGDGTPNYPDSVNLANTSGNDTITVNGNTQALILGDNAAPNVDAGNDTITVNGTSSSIYGDYYQGNANGGDDVIVVNGTAVGDVNGDVGSGVNPASNQTGGDDTITINGSAEAVTGDLFFDPGSDVGGDDTIIINGTVDSVTGDLFYNGGTDTGGNDIIIIANGAVVNGNVTGETGAVIGGDDSVTIEVGAVITGVISGGNTSGDHDILTLTGTTSDVAGYNQVQALVGCNPCNGSVTVDGITYTFTNFEQLINLLVLVINPTTATPVTISIKPVPPPTLLCGDITDDNNLLMYRLWSGELEFYSGMQLSPSQPFLVGKISHGELENGLRTFATPDGGHPGWHIQVFDMADSREGYFAQIFDGDNHIIAESCPFTIS